MLAEQAAAYYDPNTDGFYIVAQMKGLMLDATIAHELQHALQDQHQICCPSIQESFHSFDHEMATRFMVEGEDTDRKHMAYAKHGSNVWDNQEMTASVKTQKNKKKFGIHVDFIKDTAFATREQNTNMPKWMKILISMSMPYG